jgi:transcriptional regulator with XRE-family HTH domain
MRIGNLQTDEAVLKELGSRLREARLIRNLSQADLASEAGLGRVTLQRIEDGRSGSTANLIRILRALDLLDDLDRLIPAPTPSPVEQLRRRGQRRRRAGSPRGPRDDASAGSEPPTKPWRWGDEGEGRA